MIRLLAALRRQGRNSAFETRKLLCVESGLKFGPDSCSGIFLFCSSHAGFALVTPSVLGVGPWHNHDRKMGVARPCSGFLFIAQSAGGLCEGDVGFTQQRKPMSAQLQNYCYPRMAGASLRYPRRMFMRVHVAMRGRAPPNKIPSPPSG